MGIYYISLLCLCYGCLLLAYGWIKWCATFLEASLLHVDGIFLVDNGFTCFLLELVRNFLHMVSYFFLFQGYSCLKPLEEYKGIHQEGNKM
jgi:hypothetical protein